MQKHTEIYMLALGYDETDFIPSEISGEKAVDIAHISARGMGGNPIKDKDRIENLMAQTREEHLRLGDKKEFMAYQYEIHRQFLADCGVKFDNDYFEQKIRQYGN